MATSLELPTPNDPPEVQCAKLEALADAFGTVDWFNFKRYVTDNKNETVGRFQEILAARLLREEMAADTTIDFEVARRRLAAKLGYNELTRTNLYKLIEAGLVLINREDLKRYDPKQATKKATAKKGGTGTPLPGDRVEMRGDRATVVDGYRVRWTPPADGQRSMASSGPVLQFNRSSSQWRAEARKDRTGWRLWSVTMPAWCGQDSYSRCSADPAPNLSPSASPSPDDPLAGVRSMLPCGPADPLRQYHSCPSPQAS